jgi:hypothetical protein
MTEIPFDSANTNQSTEIDYATDDEINAAENYCRKNKIEIIGRTSQGNPVYALGKDFYAIQLDLNDEGKEIETFWRVNKEDVDFS